MARFRLVVMPDGHAILTTPERLEAREQEQLTALLKYWKDTPAAIAVMDSVDVVQVTDVEFELVPAAAL